MTRTGPRNLITDVAGLAVGNADDDDLLSGTTVLLCEAPTVAAVDLRGGAPGTRETDLLSPEMTVAGIDALVITGGSAFGLDAASGVQAWLRERGRGFAIGPARVPIVPAANLFDLLNGGNKDWGLYPPYRELGYAGCATAGDAFELGSVGAGLGATTATFRGGLGSASQTTATGHMVGALVAVNALGSATIGDGPHFWAAPWEIDGEFGGHALPPAFGAAEQAPRSKLDAARATTLAAVATDAALSKAEAERLAVMAQDGLARALHPVHTPLDGDIVFALATAKSPLAEPTGDMLKLGTATAQCLARAIARAIHEAGADGRGPPALPAYRDRFPPPGFGQL